ncbi:Glycoprotein-N-acetylgalactosamine 3-beta-galactosyltransferase 1 [Bienertia sinuspersici]
MKASHKDPEKLIWDQMRSPSSVTVVGSNQNKAIFPKLMLWLILCVSVTYLVYTLKLVSNPHSCDADNNNPFHSRHSLSSADIEHRKLSATAPSIPVPKPEPRPEPGPTNISHIVFGIGGSANLWEKRKNYIKVWYNKSEMRGIVWLDGEVPRNNNDDEDNNNNNNSNNNNENDDDKNLPEIRISEDTSKFRYTNKQGHRSAIRISRIVSETLKLGLKDVRWFVLGDDDTVFVKDNLVRVLNKYDHRQYYYIGSNSESHLQNIYFSYAMAYGGGGFAISYPLAVALQKIQDRCIQRYPVLYGSDDRIQACMAELGVPLTKELGFHQYDVYGNLFGLLAAHPVTPFVSLHHLDVVEPIFPNVTQVQALQRLTIPMKLDSAGLMQQSVCYYKAKKWTISVSWGFAVQIIRGVLSPREMEMPTRTFLNWYRRADYTAYAFNTRPVARNPCQKPFVFYLSKAKFDKAKNQTVSEYLRHRVQHPLCRWRMTEPSIIDKVIVYKKPDPQLWNRSPRRNCCRILKSRVNGTMLIDVGVCKEGEVIEV